MLGANPNQTLTEMVASGVRNVVLGSKEFKDLSGMMGRCKTNQPKEQKRRKYVEFRGRQSHLGRVYGSSRLTCVEGLLSVTRSADECIITHKGIL